MADKNYINRLIDGDARAFDEIYYAYKDLFIGVLRKSYGHDYDHAIDLYHRAMAALDNNVRRGRIKHDELPDEKLKAYIINTGKWISLNDHRKRQTPIRDYWEKPDCLKSMNLGNEVLKIINSVNV